MCHITSKCEKLVKKFNNKKAAFQRIIERWKTKGWNDVHKKGMILLGDADQLAQELSQDIIVSTEGKVEPKILELKLKKFKTIYGELCEATKPIWRQWLEAIVIALVLAIVLRQTIFSPYHVPTGSAEPNILVGDRIWGNKMAYYFDDPKRGDLVIFDDPRHIYDDNWMQYLWQRYVGFELPIFGLKSGPINVVKRVIAAPGDIIEGRIEGEKTVIYLNNKKLNESYVNPYPLISLKKEVGLVSFEGIGPFGIPSFLKRKPKLVRYTYDPKVSFRKQPFYVMKENDVIKMPGTNKPLLDFAYTPGYSHDISVDIFGPMKMPEGMYFAMGDSRKNSEDSRYWGLLDRSLVRGRASFILFSIDSEEVIWLFDFIKHPIDFWTKHIRWNRIFKGLN